MKKAKDGFLYIRLTDFFPWCWSFHSYISTTECGFASGMDYSANRQVPDNTHHCGVVYNINSFNSNNFKIQDSGNLNHSMPLSSSSCRSSVISDHAMPFIRSFPAFASWSWTIPWPTSFAKSCSHGAGSNGPLGLHDLQYIVLSSLTTAAVFCVILCVIALHVRT